MDSTIALMEYFGGGTSSDGNLRLRRRPVCIAIAILAIAVIHGCRDTPTASVPDVEKDPDIHDYVVGDAATALGSSGRFSTSSDVAPGLDGVSIVSSTYARELAQAFVKSFGPAFLPFWLAERGAPIALPALQPAERVFPMETSFEAFPDVGCHPAWSRIFGSHYLLTLDDGDEPQVTMSVSAQLTDYSVSESGELVSPPLSGGGFSHAGIPPDHSRTPLSPEQAVALAARATGARVTTPPALLVRGAFVEPMLALWRVLLDRDVLVTRTDGQQEQTRELFVAAARGARFHVPALFQPSSVTFVCTTPEEESARLDVTLRVRDGHPISFEAVTLTAP